MAGVDFRGLRPKNLSRRRSRPRGGSLRRTAPAWGLAQFGREVFCPWRPLEVRKAWHALTFAAAELLVGARTLDPKGDAYYGS